MTQEIKLKLLLCPCCSSPARMSDEYKNGDGESAVECSECNLMSWTVADWNRRAAVNFAWAITGSGRLWYGEYAEEDAKREAAHVGGDCQAFPVYRDAQPAAPAGAEIARLREALTRTAEECEEHPMCLGLDATTKPTEPVKVDSAGYTLGPVSDGGMDPRN